MPLAEGTILKAVVSAARFLAPKVAERRRRSRLETRVVPLIASLDQARMRSITADEIARINVFLASPEFEHITLRLTVAVYTGENEGKLAAVRQELRQVLRLLAEVEDNNCSVGQETWWSIDSLSVLCAVKSNPLIVPSGCPTPG